MTGRPRLYPGHKHQWTDADPELFTNGLAICDVCDLEMPRNVVEAYNEPRARVAYFPQIENGIAYTAAELDAALTADEDAQPEQETRADA